MILADLDRELAGCIADLVADGLIPPAAARIAPGRTWRPAPDGNPASFATSVAFQLAALAGGEPAGLAARLAAPLARLPWVTAAAGTGGGYLTITVTARALGLTAARIIAAGTAAGRSTILAGTSAGVPPWPDLAAAPGWRHAWESHAAAMTGRLAAAAGADATDIRTRERRTTGADAARIEQPAGTVSTRNPTTSVAAAVAWHGVPVVRYGLGRTAPGQVAQLGRLLAPGAPGIDPLYRVQHARASAVSVQRWAADLCLPVHDPGDEAGELLCSPAERTLLGLLQWLPVRIAAAAARRRPNELPGYLEEVGTSWLAVRQVAPALPFGGRAAPADPATAGARLQLAGAVHAVLASGLALTGVSAGTGGD